MEPSDNRENDSSTHDADRRESPERQETQARQEAGGRQPQPVRQHDAAQQETPVRQSEPAKKQSSRQKRAAQATRRERAKEVYDAKKQQAKQAAYDKTPDRFKNATSLQVRFRTGAVYVGVSVICVLVNDITTMVYLALVSGVCAGEFYYMMRADAKLPNELIGIVGAIAFPVAMWRFGLAGLAVVNLALVLALIVWYVYWMRSRIHDVAVSFFGACYTGMLLSSLLPLRQALPQPWGGVLLLLLFCSVWFNDAAAYLVGSKIGKHKLAPRTSPKKSWEGFIAGLVVSAAFWVGISFIPGVSMPLPQAIVFGVLCGGAGVMGDLAESRIKRNVGVKDSGTIMPGHGGLLDRTDSLFLSSITAAVLLFAGGCIPYAF